MSLILLKPACKAASRLTDGDPRPTTQSDEGGPLCPFCRSTMRPHKKHGDPHIVQCVYRDCIAYSMPWRSTEEALNAVPGAGAPELETDDDV